MCKFKDRRVHSMKGSKRFNAPIDLSACMIHNENMPIQIYRKVYLQTLKISDQKKKKNSDKNSDIFHISAQNIDCGYSLEPPRFLAGIRKIMYTPVNPSFTI